MKRINYALNSVLTDAPFIIVTSIYTALIAINIYYSPTKGITSVRDLFLNALIILFFVFIPISLTETLTQKKHLSYNCTAHPLILIIKAFILSCIPCVLSISLGIRVYPIVDIISLITPFFVVFLSYYYWILVINVLTLWLKKATLLIILLFVFYPGLSEYIERWTFHKILPFEIVFTIIQKLKEGLSPIYEVSLLFIYAFILFFIYILRLKKLCAK